MGMRLDSQHLQELLNEEIPITEAMGLKVLGWEGDHLRLQLPLEPNINHANTVFGGSLYSLAVLAGWSWIHARLHKVGIQDGHLVIHDSRIAYPLPVYGKAIAVCVGPDDSVWEKFERTYRRRGLARVAVTVRVLASDGRDAVRFEGEYVLHR